jgi:hypothetical protein
VILLVKLFPCCRRSIFACSAAVGSQRARRDSNPNPQIRSHGPEQTQTSDDLPEKKSGDGIVREVVSSPASVWFGIDLVPVSGLDDLTRHHLIA